MAKRTIIKKKVEVDADESDTAEFSPSPYPVDVQPTDIVDTESDVRRPELTGESVKQKPKYDQPGTNNQSRTVITEETKTEKKE